MKNIMKITAVLTLIVLSLNAFSQKGNSKAGLDAQFLVSSYKITAGDCVYFTDMTTGNPTHWQWTFEGAQTPTSTEQHPQNICYYHPGVYSVILEVQNGAMVNTEVVTECITAYRKTANDINPLFSDSFGQEKTRLSSLRSWFSCPNDCNGFQVIKPTNSSPSVV